MGVRLHNIDYRNDGDITRRAWFNRGFMLYDVPRVILRCRLLGHKPVVDGVDYGTHGERSRWVCCDRCGVRPEPQGRLDPDKHTMGELYAGSWADKLPNDPVAQREAIHQLKQSTHPPGPWPRQPTGTLSAQVVLGRSLGGVAAEVDVGHPGDESVLSGHVRLHHLIGVYLSSSRHGEFIVRRLNPMGYVTRVIGAGVDNGRLWWKLWADRDSWSTTTPRWQDGSITVDPREVLFGRMSFSASDVGDPVELVVRMPDGDEYTVTAQLQKVSSGRARQRRKKEHWSVKWSTDTGIPYRSDDSWKGNAVLSSGVKVSNSAVTNDRWRAEAAAKIALHVTRSRIRHNYRPPEPAPARSKQRQDKRASAQKSK